MSSRTFEAPNISCGHCVRTIEREVGEMEGVERVSAEESSRRVTVEWDDDATSWDEIEAFLDEIGYPPASA